MLQSKLILLHGYILLLALAHALEKNCNNYITKEYGSFLVARQLRIKSTTKEGSVKIVTFNCHNKDFYLNGQNPLICDLHGKWNDTLPKCLKLCPEILPRKISDDIKYRNATNSIETDTGDRRQNATVHVTCTTSGYMVSGSPYLTCLFNASWDYQAPLCVLKPPEPLPLKDKLYIICGSVGGVVVILGIINITWVVYYRRRKQRLKSNSEYPGDTYETLPSERFYKVWSCRRKTRKVIKGQNLEELKVQVKSAFSISSSVKILIEEDGTEIDTDESLDACANKVLLALSNEDAWIQQSELENKDSSSRFTYDICSFDRKSRKLVLADGIKDLTQQGSLCFGYDVVTVCLESDGTKIEEDRTLLAYVKNVMMLLGPGHIWAPGYSAFGTDKDSVYSSNRKMFKIKSRKGNDKVVIVADNVVELHLTAVKVLKLNAPVQIHTEEGTIIQTDADLMANEGKVLVVSEMNASNGINGTYSSRTSRSLSLYTESTSGYRYLPEVVERKGYVRNGGIEKNINVSPMTNGIGSRLYPSYALGPNDGYKYQESFM